MALISLAVGCLLMLASFPLLMYVFILSRKPLSVILSLLAALFYLLAVTVAAVVMYPIPLDTQPAYTYPLLAVTVASVAQESCRYIFNPKLSQLNQDFFTQDDVVIYETCHDMLSPRNCTQNRPCLHPLLPNLSQLNRKL
jgi:branched-subunit amino acid ABC-type transport system permease component